ncbi:MAG: sodium:alanine symporter family protein [Bacteroidetes bacterium]|nr:MAG: sodium:alanine symporter family protein [Bacteroidota bacterium]
MDTLLAWQSALDSFLQPILIVILLGAGVFLTVRLGFIQFRRLGHGLRVVRGDYDDPNHPGDVSHFQALTTALSATVGIGNIAGVAIAIHWGGPGAVFWMWLTAVLGMATKYTEVTLAQRFRQVTLSDSQLAGTVSGGPMYYIERGLGPRWKPLAIFVAFALMLTSFLTGNAIQANTVADMLFTEFGAPVWATGLITAGLVGIVIFGGIRRIGKVTGVLAPVMGVIYVAGGLIILGLNYQEVLPAFGRIFSEAFNPTAGIAGTGIGIFLQTMLWGVKRGLFSNEAGQGSAPIAHSAAKTPEPVSEGVVALLEPFTDTLIICSITALVILSTGVWQEQLPSALDLNSGDLTWVEAQSLEAVATPEAIAVELGRAPAQANRLAWHEIPVARFYIDEAQSQPFTGTIDPATQQAVAPDGTTYTRLYGPAVESGAPLTATAFSRGLGKAGNYIVVLCVFLFGISTAISWSYYGDRCAHYLFGLRALIPFKAVFILMHFLGAVTSLNTIWGLGDTALSLVTIPNVFSLILLSGVVKKLTDTYFQEKPYLKGK